MFILLIIVNLRKIKIELNYYVIVKRKRNRTINGDQLYSYE